MRPKLGQHFLINKAKIKKIAAALAPKENETVLDIGAGHGELTRALLKYPNVKVIALEKDKGLVEEIKKTFQFSISNFQTNSNDQNPKLEIIHGDALKILPILLTNYKLPITNYKLVGNIPYYITGRLLRLIGDLITKDKLPITACVFTLQKEVAERICAKPPKMNLLAATVQFWAEPEIVDFIPKKDFRPQPKVASAIIKLTNRKWQLLNKNDSNHQSLATNYYKLVRILFKQPRKTILNNLVAWKSKNEILAALEKIKINPAARPQNLTLENIKKLAVLLN